MPRTELDLTGGGVRSLRGLPEDTWDRLDFNEQLFRIFHPPSAVGELPPIFCPRSPNHPDASRYATGPRLDNVVHRPGLRTHRSGPPPPRGPSHLRLNGLKVDQPTRLVVPDYAISLSETGRWTAQGVQLPHDGPPIRCPATSRSMASRPREGWVRVHPGTRSP